MVSRASKAKPIDERTAKVEEAASGGQNRKNRALD
jgi:hypothetical protein